MKYFKCIYNDGKEEKEIELINITEEKAKELEGKIFCNGVNKEGVICKTPLFSAHNAFDGGKTMHFRARNEMHIEGCPYKDIKVNGGGKNKGTIEDGYFTRGQINSYVRDLEKRLINPPKIRKPEGGNHKIRKVNDTSNNENSTGNNVKGGNVVAGDIDAGKKGRMRTTREVTADDIGSEVGVYGHIKSFIINEYGEVTIRYKEKRLDNIQVRIGQIYKNNNPQEFEKMYKVKEYIDYLKKNKQDIFCVSAGLVNRYNDDLVIELQTDYSFRINKNNILDIIRKKF